MLRISEITKHLKEFLTNCGSGARVLQKKSARRWGVAAQLSISIPGGELVAWKKNEYLAQCHGFSSIFHHVFRNIIGH